MIRSKWARDIPIITLINIGNGRIGVLVNGSIIAVEEWLKTLPTE